MPSIIEGYNYDIFISYHQIDNKGDRWMSEFVDALKTPALPAGMRPAGNFVMIL